MFNVFYTSQCLQANRPDAGQHDDRYHGGGRVLGQLERSAVRRARAVQDLVAVLPARQPAHRPHLAPGHHVHAAVRAATRRGQLQLRRLAVLVRALLGREGGRHVDDDRAQRWQPTRQPARHTQKVATDILRHGHQPDTAAVAALATVAAVRHIAATATAAAAPPAVQGLHRRFPVRSVGRRQWTGVRHTVHIPLQHRRNTVAGRFPEFARRVRRRRQ